MRKDKKRTLNLPAIILKIFFGILIVLVVLTIISLKGKDYSKIYAKRIDAGEIINPTKNLSLQESAEQFDEEFVYYFLYTIKAYNLHDVPLTNNKPKIGFLIGSDAYNAIINDGEIIISAGNIIEEDIKILTSKIEVTEMINNQSHIQTSFRNGDSICMMIADETILFAKGYLTLYSKLIGETFTGFFLKNID